MENKFSSGYNLTNEFKDFDKNFVIALSIIAGIVAIIGSILNYTFNFPLILNLIPIAGAVFFALSYYLAKFTKKIWIAKLIVTINSLLVVNTLWFFNFGSNGPAPYFFVVLYSILIFIWHGRELIIITILMGINIIGIFLLDIYVPGLTEEYNNELVRLLDTYSGILMYIIITFVILRLSKTSYIKEYRKAKESDLLKSAFLANMSHEIRTPLNSIVGFSDMIISDKYSKEEKEEFHKIIQENNQQLLDLINDILDVSKIEVGQLKLSLSPCNITDLMKNLNITYQKSLKERINKNVKLIFDYPEKDFALNTDKSRLKQILSNLIDNAIKFTTDGYIKVSCEIQEENIYFAVEDTGIGISEEHQKNIFSRFYKVEGKKENKIASGTGIGLFLTSSFVEMLGGEINLDSKPNKGSKFYFTLPKNNFHFLENNKREEADNEISNFKNETKLLIAEDDEANQFYLKTLLKRMGITPSIVDNGKDAVEFLKKNSDTQIVLMDVKMPIMDGFEAIKEIRKFNPHIHIVAQTAHAMSDDKEQCLNAGFNDYITKPINVKQLKTIINNVVEE